MIFRIPSSKHYARPWRLGFWWNRRSFTWWVKFNESCRYDLQSDDQLDTNKLCGVGYLFGGHHIDSTRFGWRYNKEADVVELMVYCYVNKERIIKPLATCDINKGYELKLHTSDGIYSFSVSEVGRNTYAGYATVRYKHRKNLQYGLWPYFGGNQKAPHEITIQLSEL